MTILPPLKGISNPKAHEAYKAYEQKIYIVCEQKIYIVCEKKR